MTYKEFFRWCEERACDGCWGYETAINCLETYRTIKETPFWERKKVWAEYEQPIVEMFVKPTNEKIEQWKVGEVHD